MTDTDKDLRALWAMVGKCMGDFGMIGEGDRIAVGLSGGKDSLLLSYALARFQRVAPVRFETACITIDGGFAEDPGSDGLTEWCQTLGLAHIRHGVPIMEAVEATGNGENPCSLCSRLRRGALHRVAKERGYNKVALGHHGDDAVETLFMNMLMAGRVACFSPVSEMTRADLTVIRPLSYVPEDLIRRLASGLGLPVVVNPCPANGHTKRQDAKDMLTAFYGTNPGSRERAMAALRNPGGPWNHLLTGK